MRNEPEYFSVYGNGYAQQRYEGMQAFRQSLPKSVNRVVWAAFAVLVVAGLGVAAQSIVPNAQAGAQFVARHLSH